MSLSCSSSGKKSENDYLPILENFVEDLLTTLNLPEWPASEIFLHNVCAILIGNLSKTTENHIVRASFLDLLGNILARMKQETLSTTENAGLFDTPKVCLTCSVNWLTLKKDVISNGQPSDEQEDASCICKKGYKGDFMLDCDSCHKWFHGHCVGVNPAHPPDTWFCSMCQIRSKVETQIKENNKKVGVSFDSFDNIVRKQTMHQKWKSR
jgi:cohesin loading factor subunit SCC2